MNYDGADNDKSDKNEYITSNTNFTEEDITRPSSSDSHIATKHIKSNNVPTTSPASKINTGTLSSMHQTI